MSKSICKNQKVGTFLGCVAEKHAKKMKPWTVLFNCHCTSQHTVFIRRDTSQSSNTSFRRLWVETSELKDTQKTSVIIDFHYLPSTLIPTSRKEKVSHMRLCMLETSNFFATRTKIIKSRLNILDGVILKQKKKKRVGSLHHTDL